MFQCDFLILGIIGKMVYVKQQIQIHHVINNYREIPFPEIPGTNTTYVRIKTIAQIISSLHQYLTNTVGRSQAICIAITAIDHESNVVRTFIIFHRVQVIRKFCGIFFQVFNAGQLIRIPQVPWEKTTCPIIDGTAISAASQSRLHGFDP